MIYTVQPFSVDKKKFGEVYNAHIAPLPDDCWVLVLDADCQIMMPEIAYKSIYKAIEKYPDTAVFGAMTNRVNYMHQCYLEEISPNDSYLFHYAIAQRLAAQWPNGESKIALTVAGFFMLFKKSYWKESKFQDEIVQDNLFFDRAFCLHAHAKRMPMRIIRGVYVWHAYRIHKDVNDKTHLL